MWPLSIFIIAIKKHVNDVLTLACKNGKLFIVKAIIVKIAVLNKI